MRLLAAASMVFLAVSPAVAQGYVALPNHLSLGIGVVEEGPFGPDPTIAFSFGFADSGNRYWPSRFSLVWEGELGPTNRTGPCQVGGADVDSEWCWDASFLVGTRFHVFRRAGRRVLPFVGLLAGGYWQGSGVEDPMFIDESFALQGGGGVDLRRKGSVHGLRLSVDYRHVFATGASRNQVRFLTAYVLGPPEPATPSPALRRP
jgi:hypothetical protein